MPETHDQLHLMVLLFLSMLFFLHSYLWRQFSMTPRSECCFLNCAIFGHHCLGIFSFCCQVHLGILRRFSVFRVPYLKRIKRSIYRIALWLVCLFVGWSVCLFVGLFVCLSICLFVCLSVPQPIKAVLLSNGLRH